MSARPAGTRPARELMRSGVVVCDAAVSVRQAARAMRDRGATSIVAMDLSGEAVGVVEERDLLRGWTDPDELTAAEVMQSEPLIVAPNEAISTAARQMLERGVSSALVAVPPPSETSGQWSEWKERGLPIGMLSVLDILSRLDELEASVRGTAGARPTESGRRMSPYVAAGIAVVVLLVLVGFVWLLLHGHPNTVSPGCSHPTQGGC